MNKNLKNKIALIVVVLVVCIYGIIGVPKGFTGQALLAAMGQRIHLGLDLKGGAHLILEVVVSEAVNAETDDAVATLKKDLQGASLTATVDKPDPNKPDALRVTGIAAGKTGDVTTLVDYLNAKSKELDPDKTGVKFVLPPNLDDKTAASGVHREVSMTLSNVPLLELLKFVSQLSNLTFTVENDGVYFHLPQ